LKSYQTGASNDMFTNAILKQKSIKLYGGLTTTIQIGMALEGAYYGLRGLSNWSARNMIYEYDARVFERMKNGGAAHNFPMSFDATILQYGAKVKVSNSYTVYKIPGFMANELKWGITEMAKNPIKNGFYEIGIQGGKITHRTFTTVGR
jgi:hypothetical protein